MFHNYLDRLHADINQGDVEMVTEAVWAVSNLIADCPDNCRRVLDNEVFNKIYKLARSHVLKQRKEALIVLSYIVTSMTPPEVMQTCLDYTDLLPAIVDGLNIKEQQHINTMLSAIETLCMLDEHIGLNDCHSFRNLLENAGVIEKLEFLKQDPNS